MGHLQDAREDLEAPVLDVAQQCWWCELLGIACADQVLGALGKDQPQGIHVQQSVIVGFAVLGDVTFGIHVLYQCGEIYWGPWLHWWASWRATRVPSPVEVG